MDEAQVQAIVDAAVAAAMAAAIPGPAGPAPLVTFARTPAQADPGILNYKSSEGMKIYTAAVAALPTKYSGNSSDMHIFLKSVSKRAQMSGWSNIITIPTGDTTTRNLCDQYGLITLENIQAHAQIYEAAQGRDAQNASQMYDFLESSLTDEAKLMVLSDYSDYTIMTGGMQIGNGPCFLKVIIRNTTVDTRSTVFHIRENLNHLEGKMLEVSYDIEAFNIYVTGQVEQLAARGESSSDLLINLFAAFMVVPDKKFVEYIEKQKDKFDEGEDVTTKKLMQVALTKYKDRKRSDTWQAPSAEAEQIMALTAQIGELQKAKASTPVDKSKREGGAKKESDGKKRTRADKYAKKYAWKLVAPATGEPTTKVVENKTYHFCPHHNNDLGAWVIHLPSKCDRRDHQKKDKSASDKIMTLTKVLQAIQEESGEVMSDEDE
jgi:hypothetical protein